MIRKSQRFSSYAAKVIFGSTLLFSLIGSGLVVTLVPKFLWKVSEEITVSTSNSLKATLSPYLNAGDWNSIAQIMTSQNLASESRTLFLLYDIEAARWVSGEDSRAELKEKLAQLLFDCLAEEGRSCRDLGSVNDAEKTWHVLVSDPVESYSTKNLRILTAVNTDAISHATSRVMYLIFSILFMMALVSFFITRHFFQKKLAMPLESLTKILKDQDTNLEKLKDFLSQSFFYEVSVIGDSVNTLWVRLFASEKEREKQARYVAIAQAVQMLAHDIRKPFSMVKITLMILKKSRSFEEVFSSLAKSEASILRAISHVDGLLEDVIEIDRNSQLNLKDASFETLLLGVIQDLATTDPAPKVSLSTSFEHRGKIVVDTLRISRVLMNILTNATEALRGSGHIHVSTQNVEENHTAMVRVEIKNNGPMIPEEIRANLFDAFFTSGKPEGTGLGLAIAKKIIESHGGLISCRSSEAEGVVFSFTVKRSPLPLQSETTLNANDSLVMGESFPKHF